MLRPYKARSGGSMDASFKIAGQSASRNVLSSSFFYTRRSYPTKKSTSIGSISGISQLNNF